MKRLKSIMLWASAGIAVIVLILWIWWPVEVYSTFISPTGKHRLVVYRYAMPLMFPGQSGDAPGKVVLLSDDGVEINQTPVSMVQNVEYVDWTENTVHVKFVLDWKF